MLRNRDARAPAAIRGELGAVRDMYVSVRYALTACAAVSRSPTVLAAKRERRCRNTCSCWHAVPSTLRDIPYLR